MSEWYYTTLKTKHIFKGPYTNVHYTTHRYSYITWSEVYGNHRSALYPILLLILKLGDLTPKVQCSKLFNIFRCKCQKIKADILSNTFSV